MNRYKLTVTALAVGMSMPVGNAVAHSGNSAAGTPVCLESNIMMADSQNAPFSNIPGPGRLLEMNTTTGERGITVSNPFTPANIGTDICPEHVSCAAGSPWKPTGNTSGGENGHAYLTSAAQHALIEHHRDGTAIKTSPVWPTSPSPHGGNFGYVPRILGNGFMPNGNIAQTVCDANFFNANNSTPFGPGESAIDPATGNPRPDNSSWMYFPPVYSTPERGANGRVLIIDQNTMEAIDEYSMPRDDDLPYANDPRWNCPAGVLVNDEGLFISMFHGDAVFVVDWKAGIDKHSRGVGSNKPFRHGRSLKLDKEKNEARVIRVIDLSNDGTGDTSSPLNYYDAPYFNSPKRRDNLRAIRMSEDGSLFGTRRSRSRDCVRGEAPGASPQGPGPACNPGVFRQHIFVVDPGENHRTGTLALDPGVNIIAGVSINRISGPGCDYINPKDPVTGVRPDLDACDVETLYVGVSAGNAGCDKDGDGQPGPGHPANQCFVPGGTVYEYLIDKAHQDGGPLAGDGSGRCNGDPNDPAGNTGCAMPIAQFDWVNRGGAVSNPNIGPGDIETVDPRMVMHIHEAYNQ